MARATFNDGPLPSTTHPSIHPPTPPLPSGAGRSCRAARRAKKTPQQLRRVAGLELSLLEFAKKKNGIVARLGRLPGLKHGGARGWGGGGADRTPTQAED